LVEGVEERQPENEVAGRSEDEDGDEEPERPDEADPADVARVREGAVVAELQGAKSSVLPAAERCAKRRSPITRVQRDLDTSAP
jgi:hypothetical protein